MPWLSVHAGAYHRIIRVEMRDTAVLHPVEGVKEGAPGGLSVEPTLIVHEDNGDYTRKLMEYYYPDRL